MRHRSTTFSSCTPLGGLLLLVLLLAPLGAHAQQWVENRSYTEGIGIKLGSSMVFHPGIGVEAGYDSNVYTTESDLVGAARLRIVPTLALATLPPQRLEDSEEGLTGKKPVVDFRLGFAGIYEDWFGKTSSLDNRRDFGVQTDLNLVLFPFGKFRLIIADQFSRSIRAPNEELRSNYTLDDNTAMLGFHVVPGSALDIGLDYRYHLKFYELSTIRDGGNYHKHDIDLNIKWKFLPKTALTFRGVVSPYLRWGDTLTSGAYDFLISDSVNLEAWVGLVGLFTPRFGIAAEVGYGAGFYDGGDDFDSVLAKAEIRFFVTPMSAIRAGFIRDFRPAYFTNFYERNDAYVSYEQLIAGRFLLSVKFRLGYWKYSKIYEPDGTESTAFNKNPRVDWPVLKGILFAEYRITDWIAVNATFEYTGSFTDTEIPLSVGGAINETYNKFEVFGGVRAMY